MKKIIFFITLNIIYSRIINIMLYKLQNKKYHDKNKDINIFINCLI